MLYPKKVRLVSTGTPGKIVRYTYMKEDYPVGALVELDGVTWLVDRIVDRQAEEPTKGVVFS